MNQLIMNEKIINFSSPNHQLAPERTFFFSQTAQKSVLNHALRIVIEPDKCLDIQY